MSALNHTPQPATFAARFAVLEDRLSQAIPAADLPTLAPYYAYASRDSLSHGHGKQEITVYQRNTGSRGDGDINIVQLRLYAGRHGTDASVRHCMTISEARQLAAHLLVAAAAAEQSLIAEGASA